MLQGHVGKVMVIPCASHKDKGSGGTDPLILNPGIKCG